ncbi:MerR family transcriptional regulator [Psychrobacillus sp. BM2]|uniref:MerR family transcriptional regulator n=1 Tax=Psychrobacillus sp. BM2 TaxID=3400421 RepID=UPI003B0153FA
MELFTIGKVSKYCSISIKTLRYYDEIGLLKPALVSEENNYRYYTEVEIQKIPLIKYYKELGFKLDDIKSLLTHYQLNTIDNYFEKELSSLEQEMANLKRKYFAVQEWKTLIEQGKHIKNCNSSIISSIELKTMPIYQTISFTLELDTQEINNTEFYFSNAFVEFCRQHNYYTYGPFMLHFENLEQRLCKTIKTVNCYSAVISSENSPHTDSIGDFAVITTLHTGSYEQLPQVYERLKKWAGDHEISLQGDSFERYIIDNWSTQDVNEYVTEVILPIELEK